MPDRLIPASNMKRNVVLALVASASLLTVCCAPAPPPPPAPPPVVVAPVPAPAPVATLAAPQYDNWLDAPQTAGDWRYDTDPNETLALFGSTVRGDDVFVIRCDKRTRRVGIARAGAVGDTAATMHIRTETADRMVEVTPLTGSRPLLTTDFAATDPLLDAMALSRGRFAIETAGKPALYLPAWPEVTRVIEDCR